MPNIRCFTRTSDCSILLRTISSCNSFVVVFLYVLIIFNCFVMLFCQISKMGTVTKGFDAKLANRPFFVYDSRALCHSTLSARVPESQKTKKWSVSQHGVESPNKKVRNYFGINLVDLDLVD